MKIGIIGTGSIVIAFLEAVKKVENISVVALYSRQIDKANQIAAKYQIPHTFDNLDRMLGSDFVDFVYIASPNSLHFQQARKSLLYGKNVICEKPFTSTLNELDELINLSIIKKLYLFEAITTIHLPNFKQLKKDLQQLGEVRGGQFTYLQYSSKYDQFKKGEIPNVFNPDFSGGALMDLNVYHIHFLVGLFGEPKKVTYHPYLQENGIDTSGTLILEYPKFVAQCSAAKDTKGINIGQLNCEKGYVYIPNGVNDFFNYYISVNSTDTEHGYQKDFNKLIYELEAFSKIYESKDYDLCQNLLTHSRSVMKVLYKARLESGIVFKSDRSIEID